MWRSPDTLARIGDDQFACLLPTRVSSVGAAAMAERVIQALEWPFVISIHRLVLAINIGISFFPADAPDGATLVRHAELALHDARRDGAGVAVHTGGNDRDALRRMALASDLRHAVVRDELTLLFQPKVAVPRGNTLGVEALLRWRSARHGVIPPDLFIPIAEETGFIAPLTRWVLGTALQQFDRWRRQESLVLPVAANLSPISLHDRGFPNEVAALLSKWSVPPACLVFEITESAIMADVARATTTVERLSAMGVRIAIDDFGTGYSSLAYIHRLPVSEIKVDKSFVLSMKTSPDDAVIVRSIIDLGRNLGLEVTAEGVEDKDAWSILSAVEYGAAQGYMISRPIDSAALVAWTRDRTWLPSTSRRPTREYSLPSAS